jgi:serine/threonine-protein kinase
MGSYELVERLGHGGMGEVWRAKHRMLARPAAIKLIRPEALGAHRESAAESVVRRFEREAQATAQLHSPHTIELYDFGVTRDGTFYYVMELLEGVDLEVLIQRFGPLPAERVVHLLLQACDSLADAHDAGLVHRDIKPANLYLCRRGLRYDFLKVLDFGLVKASWRDSGEDTRLTTEGMAGGTPAYMAPEVALGNRQIDARVDLYALGCVGYWLLTGRTVFESQTAMQMALHHLHTAPVPPSRRSELPIPPALEGLVLACLEKDPERRPGSAEELSRALAACPTDAPWSQERARRWWETNLPRPTSVAPGSVDDEPTIARV